MWALLLTAYDYQLVYREGCKHGNADVLSRLPLPDTLVTAPALGENTLLMDRLEVIPVKADHIVDSTASDPVLHQFLRRVQHGWGDGCPDKSLELFYVRRNELSTHNGCIACGNRVVIPVRGQKKLLEKLLTAHPGMVRWKIWRGATYGCQGWIQKLKIRSSHAEYVNFIELHLRIPGSGLKSAGPAYM